MKNSIFFLLLSLFIVSCGGGGNDNNSSSTMSEMSEQSDEFTSDAEPADAENSDLFDSGDLSDECLKFLSSYEEFMDDYIALLKKYKQNPSDMSILKEYTEMLGQSTKWAEGNEDCAVNPEFYNKFTEIQMKIANAASEF